MKKTIILLLLLFAGTVQALNLNLNISDNCDLEPIIKTSKQEYEKKEQITIDISPSSKARNYTINYSISEDETLLKKASEEQAIEIIEPIGAKVRITAKIIAFSCKDDNPENDYAEKTITLKKQNNMKYYAMGLFGLTVAILAIILLINKTF